MGLLFKLVQLCQNLPWWGFLAVFAGLTAIGCGLSWYIRWKFDNLVHEIVLNVGAVLKGANVVVHSVTATTAPKEPSPYDLDEDDEQYSEDIDGTAWDEEGVSFYRIEATISPADPEATWDPTALAIVPADFTPDDPTDACIDLGALHSAERFVNGSFQPAPEGEVRGPQRLRMLFAIGDQVRAVKFASGVNYFGEVALPAPLPKTPSYAAQR